jgi:hypothetical protein
VNVFHLNSCENRWRSFKVEACFDPFLMLAELFLYQLRPIGLKGQIGTRVKGGAGISKEGGVIF